MRKPKNEIISRNREIPRRAKTTIFIFAFMFFCQAAIMPGAFAAGGDPIGTINNLSDFIFSAIKAIGVILLGFGIVQIGLSLKGHDPSQRANGFLTLFGGVVIFFAKEILDLITG